MTVRALAVGLGEGTLDASRTVELTAWASAQWAGRIIVGAPGEGTAYVVDRAGALAHLGELRAALETLETEAGR